MPNNLECPATGTTPDWSALYRARGDEVSLHRPVFTGDAYNKLEIPGESKLRSVIILQHPCALRMDGVKLRPTLLVAKIDSHPLISPESWTGHISKMPLPDLVPGAGRSRQHQAAFFDHLYLVSPENLDATKRIACLSQAGVNILLQRWVHHNSRVVVPTWQYQDVTGGQYEEADLTEYWCDERVDDGISLEESSAEAHDWLREDLGEGVTRQSLLENRQNRSEIRRQMRSHLRSLRKN